MANRVHLLGASGSGTTTLGRALAMHLDTPFLDTDDYYWANTDPPFTTKRDRADRIAAIREHLADRDSWVLSGSMCNWGEPFFEEFTLVVFLRLNVSLRMQRIEERERQRYGMRIDADGDMHKQHLQFLEWARSYDTAEPPVRSLELHRRWLETLSCQVIELNSELPVPDLLQEVEVRLR